MGARSGAWGYLEPARRVCRTVICICMATGMAAPFTPVECCCKRGLLSALGQKVILVRILSVYCLDQSSRCVRTSVQKH